MIGVDSIEVGGGIAEQAPGIVMGQRATGKDWGQLLNHDRLIVDQGPEELGLRTDGPMGY